MSKNKNVDQSKLIKEFLAEHDNVIDLLLGGHPIGIEEGKTLTFVAQSGGGEGGGEYCFTIFNYNNQYYKVEYSYASYDGYYTDYLKVFQVKPVTRTVVQFE